VKIELPLGSEVTLKANTEPVTVSAVPREVQAHQTLHIHEVNRRTGMIEFDLDGGTRFFLKAGDSLTLNYPVIMRS
jgi:hypothetical protein